MAQPGWRGANPSDSNCDICNDSTKERKVFHLIRSTHMVGLSVLDHLTLCITCADAGALGECWHGCGCGG